LFEIQAVNFHNKVSTILSTQDQADGGTPMPLLEQAMDSAQHPLLEHALVCICLVADTFQLVLSPSLR